MPCKTPELQRAYQLKWVHTRRNAWIESQGGKCVQCGSTEKLEVDHIDPTTKKWKPSSVWSRKQVDRDMELAKCQVLCKECHEIKTAGENRERKGEKASSSKLKECQVLEIKRQLAEGAQGAALAAQYGVSKGTISSIKTGDSWGWL